MHMMNVDVYVNLEAFLKTQMYMPCWCFARASSSLVWFFPARTLNNVDRLTSFDVLV